MFGFSNTSSFQLNVNTNNSKLYDYLEVLPGVKSVKYNAA